MFFCNSGAEANEASVKMARRFHYRQNKKEKFSILCAGGAFHGRTLGMLSATANPIYREGFGPSVAGFEHVVFGNLNELRNAVNESTAAIMIEPVQGEGGANAAPAGFGAHACVASSPALLDAALHPRADVATPTAAAASTSVTHV